MAYVIHVNLRYVPSNQRQGCLDRIRDMLDCVFGILQLEQPQNHLKDKDDSFFDEKKCRTLDT